LSEEETNSDPEGASDAEEEKADEGEAQRPTREKKPVQRLQVSHTRNTYMITSFKFLNVCLRGRM
jgi:hypothetical protein